MSLRRWTAACALWVVEPDAVDCCPVDVDHHDMPPTRGGRVTARRSIDAEGSPQEIGQNLRRQRLGRIFSDRTPQAQRFDQWLAALAPRPRQVQRRQLLSRGGAARRCNSSARNKPEICFASRDHVPAPMAAGASSIGTSGDTGRRCAPKRNPARPVLLSGL